VSGSLVRRLAARTPRLAPTRRLAALLVLLSPLWLLSGLGAGLAVAAGALFLAAAATLFDALALPGEGRVEVRREGPFTVGLGERGAASYVVRSSWPRPLHGTLADRPPAAVEREGAAALEVILAPRGAEELLVRFVGRGRGRFPLGPAALVLTGPLGLVRRTLRYALDDAVTVTPSFEGVRRYRLLALQHRLADAGVRTIRRRGAGTSFERLREYVPGDDPRRVDWKATAKRGRLITREFTVEQGQTVLLAIDAGRLMTQLAGELPRFEYALSAAFVLADVALSARDRVGLMIFDDEVRAFVPPGRGAQALHAVREALVPATARMAEPDYAGAFRTLATRHRKRSLVVVISDVVDPRASQAFLSHVARSTAHHFVLVVALRNDRLEAATRVAPGADAEALYRAAAAEELLAERAEALQGLRRAGVDVLDVEPRAMMAAVVNRYLAIKGRGAI
jgi:uncharacterized protein (DUF58 family)